MRRLDYFSLTVLMLWLPSSSLFATEQCRPASMTPTPTVAESFRLSADEIKINPNQISVLQGKVQLQQDRNRILADRVAVDSDNEKLTARGNVRYTNCNIQTPPWFISADTLTLDRNKGTGTIKKAWLHLGTIPFLYLPRYRMQLSEHRRRSGVLPPRLNYHSNSGVEAGSPLYFNIAPNKDLTITPKVYSQRGAAVDVDARYLYAREQGKFGFSWLDDSDYDDDRYLYFFEHNASGDDLFHLDINVQRVSDADYIEDLAGNIDLLNESYLRSYVESDLFWRGWNFNFQTEFLQRADEDASWLQQPYQYQLRPGFKATRLFSNGPLGMNFEFQSQAAQFVHKYSYLQDSDGRREYIPVGNRFHNSIRMDWLHQRPWFFFAPAVTIAHTHYKIYRQGTINRSQPIYSVHSGLIFEKTPHRDDTFRHTIEPTLFYLNVPSRRQDDIPLFDTTANEFNFHSLFLNNRFNGIDRIGDADQLTLALNSRLLHRRSGKQALRASIGRVYYFRDQQVHLNQRSNTSQPQSPLISELELNLNNKVKFLSSWVWDSKRDQTLKLNSKLSLKGARNRIVNLYYRSQADAFNEQLPQAFESNRGLEQAGINLGMPLSDNWRMLAGWSYDFDADDSLSSFFGVEYKSCCWSAGFNIQRRLVDVDNAFGGRLDSGGLDYETYIGFEFNLEGLGALGNNLDDTLGDKVFGYH